MSPSIELDDYSEQDDKSGQPVPGHYYSIIRLHEDDDTKLIEIRDPYGEIEKGGEYGPESDYWEEHAGELEYDPDDDGTYWLSLDEYLQNFNTLVICRTIDWSEIRVKGKFIRVKSSDDPDIEKVLTKFFYKVHVKETSKVFITMHQDDEKVYGGDR